MTPPDRVTPELGPWLRRARAARGLTQVSVADRMTALGFATHQTKIAKIEQGVLEPTLSFAVALIRMLGSTPDVALGLSKCPKCGGEPPSGFTCNTCGLTS